MNNIFDEFNNGYDQYPLRGTHIDIYEHCMFTISDMSHYGDFSEILNDILKLDKDEHEELFTLSESKYITLGNQTLADNPHFTDFQNEKLVKMVQDIFVAEYLDAKVKSFCND